MKTNFLKSLALLTAAAVPGLALSQSDAVAAAQDSVRNTIQDRLGSQYNVIFDRPSEKWLSLDEEIVSGRGHARLQNDWYADKPFDYSVKAMIDGTRTREVLVTFTDGQYSSPGRDWHQTNTSSQVDLTRPKWEERFTSNDVRFEGSSKQTVIIRIYDRRNQEVASAQAFTMRGRFRKSIRLPDGQYRAVVAGRLNDRGQEVRFSVNTGSYDWGQGDVYLKILQPSSDALVRGSKIVVNGNSSESKVRVQVWDSSNYVVAYRDVPVKDRYWGTELRLTPGAYKMQVTSGKQREMRQFTMVSDAPSYVRVFQPYQGEKINGSSVTVSGNTTSRELRISIFDDRNRRVAERRVGTKNGNYSSKFDLGKGYYQLKVEDESSKTVETRDFHLRGDDQFDPKPIQPMIGVRVMEPRRDSTVSGPRVTFSGNSSSKDVRIQIFREKKSVVEDRNVPTRGNYWNTQIVLNPGQYRVRVTAGGGNDYEEFWFTVR